MQFKYLFFSIFLIVGNLSCDEVSPSINLIQTDRVVLIEEYTGVRCQSCPGGSDKIQDIIAQISAYFIVNDRFDELPKIFDIFDADNTFMVISALADNNKRPLESWFLGDVSTSSLDKKNTSKLSSVTVSRLLGVTNDCLWRANCRLTHPGA